MVPFLSSHYHQTISIVEMRNYDVKLIVQPLNPIGFESNTKPEDLARIIQNTKIQILNLNSPRHECRGFPLHRDCPAGVACRSYVLSKGVTSRRPGGR